MREALEGIESAATWGRPVAPQLVREGSNGGSPNGEEVPQIDLFRRREGAGAETQDKPLEPVPPKPELLQIHNSFILAETRDGVIIVDQHAAHERVLYERLVAGLESGADLGQRLLFPFTVRLTRLELEAVEAVKETLAQVGFGVDCFGADTLLVQSVPSPHPYFDAQRCLREMITDIVGGSDLVRSSRNQQEGIAMTFACKAAIKAGQKLSSEEMHELFDQLFATSLPFHDIHGRPTVVSLNLDELAVQVRAQLRPASRGPARPARVGTAAAVPAVFLAVTGPTGAGKTALSLLAARELGGEIVSMDSRQIYRGMDIGTAKATARERAAIPHYGLDIRDPGERYSAGAFGRDARRWIADIRARGRGAAAGWRHGFLPQGPHGADLSRTAARPGAARGDRGRAGRTFRRRTEALGACPRPGTRRGGGRGGTAAHDPGAPDRPPDGPPALRVASAPSRRGAATERPGVRCGCAAPGAGRADRPPGARDGGSRVRGRGGRVAAGRPHAR